MVSRYGPVKQEGLCILPPPPTHYRMLPPQSKSKIKLTKTHHVLALSALGVVVLLQLPKGDSLSALDAAEYDFSLSSCMSFLFHRSANLFICPNKTKNELLPSLLLQGWAVVIAFIITCIMLVDLASWLPGIFSLNVKYSRTPKVYTRLEFIAQPLADVSTNFFILYVEH